MSLREALIGRVGLGVVFGAIAVVLFVLTQDALALVMLVITIPYLAFVGYWWRKVSAQGWMITCPGCGRKFPESMGSTGTLARCPACGRTLPAEPERVPATDAPGH
jgi:hypothetical protein